MSADRGSSRRNFLKAAAVAGAGSTFAHALPVVTDAPQAVTREDSFELNELTVAQLQQGMKSGRFTRSTTSPEKMIS